MAVLIGRRAASTFSFMATCMLVAYGAWTLGGFRIVIPDLWLLVTLQFEEIARNHSTFEKMLSVILAVLVIDLPCSVGAGMVQSFILGKHQGEHAMNDLLDTVGKRRVIAWMWQKSRRLKQLAKTAVENEVGSKREERNFFQYLFVLVVVEELFARWFFLGFIPEHFSLFAGTFGLVAMFFVGNSLWALAHLKNFRREEDRNPLRVAPQFMSGIFFSYVFLKYGFTASCLTHFAANAILMATHKHQRFDAKDIVLIAVAGIYAAVSYEFIGHPLTDLVQWIEEEPTFTLAGWTTSNYIALGVFVPSFLAFLFGALLYDRSNINPGTSARKKASPDLNKAGLLLVTAVVLVLYIAAFVGIVYLAFWALGFFVASVPLRITIIAIGWCFHRKGSSGSSAANTFWTSLPETYITICTLEALHTGQAIGVFCATIALLIPFYLLKQVDD